MTAEPMSEGARKPISNWVLFKLIKTCRGEGKKQNKWFVLWLSVVFSRTPILLRHLMRRCKKRDLGKRFHMHPFLHFRAGDHTAQLEPLTTSLAT